MRKTQSVVSLDPIDVKRKRQDSVISRLFKTRHYGGKHLKPEIPFGHYMFCGPQGSSKTTSAIWYTEMLIKKYTKSGWKLDNLFANFPLGVQFKPITKMTLFPTIFNLPAYDREDKTFNIIVIDEIQSYFPKDFADRTTKDLISQLVGCFSQLRKRHCFVLSTAQVYGRLDKNLREQCLFMVSCRHTKFSNKCVNDFIPADDIICDDLGRWSGIPQKIYVHGLPKTRFNSSYLIKQ